MIEISIRGSFSGDRYCKMLCGQKSDRLGVYRGFQPPLYCNTKLHIHTDPI